MHMLAHYRNGINASRENVAQFQNARFKRRQWGFFSNNNHLDTTDILTGALNGNKSWGVRESFGNTTVQAGAATTYLIRKEEGMVDPVANWVHAAANVQRDIISSRYFWMIKRIVNTIIIGIVKTATADGCIS